MELTVGRELEQDWDKQWTAALLVSVVSSEQNDIDSTAENADSPCSWNVVFGSRASQFFTSIQAATHKYALKTSGLKRGVVAFGSKTLCSPWKRINCLFSNYYKTIYGTMFMQSKIFITMLRRCISPEVRVVARVATRVANRPSREDITLLCIFL